MCGFFGYLLNHLLAILVPSFVLLTLVCLL